MDRRADLCALHGRGRCSRRRRRQPPVLAISTTFSSPGSLTGSGPSALAGTSSIRRRCCASLDGRRNPQRLDRTRAAFSDLLRLAGIAGSHLDVYARGRCNRRGVAAGGCRCGVRAWSQSNTRTSPCGSSSTRRSCRSPVELALCRRPTRAALRCVASRLLEPIDARTTGGHPCRGVLGRRARAIPGLPVQVFCGGRAAARGTARGRADAVAAGSGASSYTSCSSASSRRGIGGATARSRVERIDEARALFEDIAEPMLSTAARSRGVPRTCATFRVRRFHGHRRRRPRARSVTPRRTCASGGSNTVSTASSRSARPAGRRVALKGWPIVSICSKATAYASSTTSRAPGLTRNVRYRRQSMRYAPGNVSISVAADRGRWTRRHTWRSRANGRWSPSCVPADPTRTPVLTAARARVLDIVDRIERGEFPPKPHDLHICTYCAYPSVCRKDYVGDE